MENRKNRFIVFDEEKDTYVFESHDESGNVIHEEMNFYLGTNEEIHRKMFEKTRKYLEDHPELALATNSEICG